MKSLARLSRNARIVSHENDRDAHVIVAAINLLAKALDRSKAPRENEEP